MRQLCHHNDVVLHGLYDGENNLIRTFNLLIHYYEELSFFPPHSAQLNSVLIFTMSCYVVTLMPFPNASKCFIINLLFPSIFIYSLLIPVWLNDACNFFLLL